MATDLTRQFNKIEIIGYFVSNKSGLKKKPHNQWQNVPRNCFNLQNCVVFYTFYPNLPIFLHRYICHTCDISQLCLQTCVGWLVEDEAPPEFGAGQREALPAGWVL